MLGPIHIQEQYGAGSANQDITQITYTYSNIEDKFRWLQTRLVEFTSTGSVLVFVTRKIKSEELAGKLRRCDYELGLLHGDMSQFERNDIITSFKRQEFRILVATDVAGKGLYKYKLVIFILICLSSCLLYYVLKTGSGIP